MRTELEIIYGKEVIIKSVDQLQIETSLFLNWSWLLIHLRLVVLLLLLYFSILLSELV